MFSQVGIAENACSLTLENDGQRIYEIIVAIFSGQGHAVTQNEQILHQLENVYGYCDVMMGLIMQHDLPVEVRVFAVIALKNLVQRFWHDRGLARQGLRVLTDEEKGRLKAFSLQYLHEPEKKVMMQLAVLASRMARFDWPKSWPGLTQNLLQSAVSVQSFSTTFQALYTLRRVIKELSTKKVMTGRLAFEADTAALLPPLVQLWVAQAQALREGLGQAGGLPTEQMQQSLEVVLVLAKIIHTLLLHGVRNYIQCEQVRPLLGQMIETLRWAHGALGQLSVQAQPTPFSACLGKLVKRLSSIVVDAQHTQPLGFRPFLEPYLDFFCNYVTTVEMPCPSAWNEFTIKSIIFISNVVSCQYYRPDQNLLDEAAEFGRIITMKGDVEVTPDSLRETGVYITNFFGSNNRLFMLTECCLKRLMLLNNEDLGDWQSDPEAFAVEQEKMTAEQKISSAAEQLLLALLEAFHDQLIPEIVKRAMDVSPQLACAALRSVTTEVLELDSFYLTFGLYSFSLDSHLNFQDWFRVCGQSLLEATLKPEHGPYSGPPILARRILWMLGCWIHQISEEIRCYLWNLIGTVLWEGKDHFDVVVKMSAITTLHSLVEAWDFESGPFNNQLPRYFMGLYDLFSHLHELDSRQKVLDVIALVTARAGSSVKPHLEILITPIIDLWQACEEQTPLHKKLVEILTSVIRIAGSEHAALHHVAYNLLQTVTDLSRPFEMYLLEDGLQLWLASLKTSPQYTNEMHSLFPNIESVLERDLEHLKPALLILEAYLVSGKEIFIQAHSGKFSLILERLIGDVSSRGIAFITRVMESALKIHAADSLPLLSPALNKILKACLDVIRGADNAEPDLTVVNYLSILARSFIASSSFFSELLERQEPGVSTGRQILVAIVNLMLEKFDSLGSHGNFSVGAKTYPYRRKAWALFLLSTLSTGETEVLRQLDQILNICLDVVCELEEPQSQKKPPQLFTIADFSENICDSTEADVDNVSEFLEAQFETDPIVTADLRKVITEQLQVCSEALGQLQFQQVLETVEPMLLKQLGIIN